MKKKFYLLLMILGLIGVFTGCDNQPKVDHLSLVIINDMSTQSMYYELSDDVYGEKSGTINAKKYDFVDRVETLEDDTFSVMSLKIYADSSKTKLLYNYNGTSDLYYESFDYGGEGGVVEFVMTEDKIIK